MEQRYLSGRDALVKAVKAAQVEQVDALVSAVEANAGDPEALATLKVDPIDPNVIEPELLSAIEEGVSSAKSEYTAQLGPAASSRERKPVSAAANEPDTASLVERMKARASALVSLLADAIGQAASRKASTVSTLPAADAGSAVRAHLQSLSDSFLNDQLGGAWHEGYTGGRKDFMKANAPKNIYASELMDGATCDSCIGVDGTEYPDIPSAEQDYPLGGYAQCDGGLRCRGTLVAKWI
jgi:hypothetical protein